MISYNSLTAAILWVVAVYLVLLVICWALSRLRSRDVTLPEVTPMSRPARWWEGARLRTWRLLASSLWRAAALLSGGRKAALERASTRCTSMAQKIERRRRRRAQDADRLDAQARAWAAHMTPIPGSSASSPSLPPSAPRPPVPALPWISPDMNPTAPEEDTRRWERTLPWGTPSPLVTREGLGRPYPFVPLAPPLPPPAPRSSRRARRAP